MNSHRLHRRTWFSLGFNLAYAGYHAVVGFASLSWWFLTLSVYYSVLSVMRFSLLRIDRRLREDRATARFASRFTGVMLVVLAVCLVGTAILAATDNRGTRHHEILMITMALYAFSKVTLAVIHLVRVRRHNAPVEKALRHVSFADALVSIYSLQRSMLVSFEGMGEADIRLMNILTGAAVCVTVLLLGINLIGGRRVTMAKSKLTEVNKAIADTVADGYKKVENTVVDGYKKVEEAVVGGYTKIEDRFVEAYLTKDGETVEDAKARLKKKDP